MAKICPKCGRTDGETEFTGAFCTGCKWRDATMFETPKPQSLLIRTCARCGKTLIANGWVESKRSMEEWLASKIKTRHPLTGIKTTCSRVKGGLECNVEMQFDAEGAVVKRSARMRIVIDSNACDSCRLKSGGYHEAVIQLRSRNKERLRSLSKRLSRVIEKESFIASVEEKKEGIDLLVGNKGTAQRAVASLGRRFTIANKQAGMKEGKQLFRASYCVRLDDEEQEEN